MRKKTSTLEVSTPDPVHCAKMWGGVYPLPAGRIRCETRNNFTLTLHNNSLNCLFIQSLPTLQLSSNSSPTLSNSPPTLCLTLTERSTIDKRPGLGGSELYVGRLPKCVLWQCALSHKASWSSQHQKKIKYRRPNSPNRKPRKDYMVIVGFAYSTMLVLRAAEFVATT